MFLQRYVKRPLHSWLLYLSSTTKCVSTKIYQKITPPLTPNSPPKQKGPNKNPLYEWKSATNFLGSLLFSKGSFSFLYNKSYLCAESIHLPHWPILCLVKTRNFTTGLQQLDLCFEKINLVAMYSLVWVRWVYTVGYLLKGYRNKRW
jgi:hypothetical protein